MGAKDTIFILLVISMTSSGTRDSDVLQSACSDACREWEDWRARCFDTSCQAHIQNGEDWFPCWLSCWDRSRECVALCADNFWKMYSVCSRRCLSRTGRKRRRCRHACVVNTFWNIKQLVVLPALPALPAENQTHKHSPNMFM